MIQVEIQNRCNQIYPYLVREIPIIGKIIKILP